MGQGGWLEKDQAAAPRAVRASAEFSSWDRLLAWRLSLEQEQGVAKKLLVNPPSTSFHSASP